MATEIPTLAAELGVSASTIQRAAETGLIHGVRRGPRRFVLVTGEKEVLHQEWRLIESLRAALRTEPSVAAAILFGSHARGDSRADSDVDLLVSLRGKPDLEHFESLRDRLTQRVGHYVDLYADYEMGSQPVAMLRIATEGRPIVDREGYWPRLRRRLPQLRRQVAKIDAYRQIAREEDVVNTCKRP